jgi:predicted enzyme related to lactoylglutathione lyase
MTFHARMGSGSYLALHWGDGITERARDRGASVILEPREGPAGWRSVVFVPAGAEVALWQPKA